MNTSKGNTKKSVEKNVVSQLRSIGKLEGYKVSSNCLYKEQGDFFLYAVIYVRERNAQLYLNLTFNIKTMQEDDFLSSVDGNENRYYQFILSQDNMIRGNLKKMIANILLKNYSKALQLASEEISVGKRGGFQNEGHDIYYFIEKYCKEKVTLKC